MREIEFRAWDQVKKKMVRCSIHQDGLAIQAGYNIMTAPTPARFMVPMQYTGLKDANGVKIFEGDILSHALGSVEGVVSFWEGSFICGISISDNALVKYNTPKYVKIIGNIYENPELLRGGA